MKISVENLYNIYRQNPAVQVKKRDETVPEIITEKKFDEVKISSKAEAVPGEKEFARVLASKLSDEIRQEVPEEKLEALKARIEAGNYEIDASAIARKILLEE